MSNRHEAIAAFYVEKADQLQRAVRHAISGSTATIEDACAHAWCQLCQAHHVELDRHGFGWLYVVAIREAYRLSERARREPAVGTPTELPLLIRDDGDLAEIAAMRERNLERLEALAALPRRRQRMVVLHAAGFTYREIAALTGDTLRTIERQLLRGKRTLRRMSAGPSGAPR